MNRDILLTGGNGFVGRNIKELLKKEGWNVSCPSKKQVNLLVKEEVRSLFKGKTYYAIIHSAISGRKNYKSIDQNIFIENIRMFNNIYSFIDKTSLFINIDSGVSLETNSNQHSINDDKNSNSILKQPYAYSKNCISKKIKIDAKSINLRLWGCFGPYEDYDKFFSANIMNYVNNKPIRIYKDRRMDFIHIYDFYKIISFILRTKDKYFLYDVNCVYDEKYKLSELAKIINSLDSHKVEILIDKKNEDTSYVGIPSKKINYQLSKIDERIKEHYRFLKNHYKV